MIASGSHDRTVRLWSLQNSVCTHILKGHTDCVWCCTFSSDGKSLFSGAADNNLLLWDTKKGRLEATLSAHTDWVTSCAISHDKKIFASGSNDRRIKLWKQQKCYATLSSHTDTVTCLSFSPDGTLLLSGSTDTHVILWQVKHGLALKTLVGHNDLVKFCMLYEGLIITMSADGIVRKWEKTTGNSLAVLGTSGKTSCCCVSPDMRLCVTVCEADRSALIWEMAHLRPPPDETHPATTQLEPPAPSRLTTSGEASTCTSISAREGARDEPPISIRDHQLDQPPVPIREPTSDRSPRSSRDPQSDQNPIREPATPGPARFTHSTVEEVLSLRDFLRFPQAGSALGLHQLDRAIETVVDFIDDKFPVLSKSITTDLSKDEIIAVVMYTFDFGMGVQNQNLYFILNEDLRQRINTKMLAWQPYLYYLLQALRKLPPVKTVVYRGVPHPRLATAQNFAGPGGVIFRIHVNSGRDIHELSYIAQEDEILLTPNTTLRVSQAVHQEPNGWLYLDMTEESDDLIF
ncbi:vegetative incompatibility het-e-1 protein [Pelomyxa schiedti]|nr:vegetative incompatibility het-e-1 protein [Pelomyxa schiedti]